MDTSSHNSDVSRLSHEQERMNRLEDKLDRLLDNSAEQGATLARHEAQSSQELRLHGDNTNG